MAFFEIPDIPEAFAQARAHGLALDMDSVTFFLGGKPWYRRASQPARAGGGALYVAASNALEPARYYNLPPGRVIELGTQVTILMVARQDAKPVRRYAAPTFAGRCSA